MEECAGGNASSRATGYGSIDFTDLMVNKKLEGKRSSPQEQWEKKGKKKKKVSRVWEFVSQNETLMSTCLRLVQSYKKRKHNRKKQWKNCTMWFNFAELNIL